MTTPEKGLCEACTAVKLTREDFDNPPFVPKEKKNKIVRSGTLGALRSKPEVLADDDKAWGARWVQNNWECYPLTDEAEELYGSSLHPSLERDGELAYFVQLVDETETDRPLRARRVPREMDIARMRNWVEKCQNEHGEHFADSYLTVGRHPSAIPGFIVINTQRMCLTKLPPQAKYVALSYVWGQTNIPVTTKSNLESFQQDGAFSRVRLARTVQHAIEVTAALGFGYVWVDALCIVQDDPILKADLIASMDTVYGNSALTILAASGGHADAGLSGWSSETTADRENAILEVRIAPNLLLTVRPCFDIELENSPYAERGWTYQEATLSPRRIIFLNGLVYFKCREAIWREDFMIEIADLEPSDGANTLGETRSEWPLRRFAQHVQAFSSRKLSYSSDKLNAFAGIQQAVAESMGDTKMWFGLPGAAFDWAILWCEHPQAANPKSLEEYPSWSWAHFDGPVTMSMDHWSEFDQCWLRQRTWIKWWISGDKGRIVPLWNPIQKANCGPRSNAEVEGDDSPTSDDEDETFMPQYDQPGSQEISQVDDKRLDLLVEIAQMSSRPGFQTLFKGMPLTDLKTERGIAQLRLHQDLPGEKILMSSGDPSFPINNALVLSSFILQDAAVISAATSNKTNQNVTRSAMSILAGDEIGGVLWQSQSPCNKTGESRQDLVILSWATPGALQFDHLQYLGLSFSPRYAPTQREDSRDGEDVLGEWHEWEFLNVLSISRGPFGKLSDADRFHSTSYEVPICRRMGVGVIHKNAVKGQKVVWDRIALI